MMRPLTPKLVVAYGLEYNVGNALRTLTEIVSRDGQCPDN
jgi:hypothetical protein